MPLIPGTRQPRVVWGQLYGAAVSYTIAQAVAGRPGATLVVADSALDADRLHTELDFFTPPDLPVLQFPDWETLPYDAFSPHPDIVSTRLETLYQLHSSTPAVVIIAASTLLQRLPPRGFVAGSSLILEVGQKLDLARFRVELERSGYSYVSQVVQHGEFAVRGSLLDVFPMGSTMPLRIDLFDDEIDSIRGFDPDTQLSAERLTHIRLLPAREYPLTEEGIKGFRLRYRSHLEGDPRRSRVYQQVSQAQAPGGIEYFLPLFFDNCSDLVDYLAPDTLLVTGTSVDAQLESAWEDIVTRYEQRRGDLEHPVLPPETVFFTPAQLRTRLDDLPRIDWQAHEIEATAHAVPVMNMASLSPPVLSEPHVESPSHSRLSAFLDGFPGRVLFAAHSTGRREALAERLERDGVQPVRVDDWSGFLKSDSGRALAVAPLERGAVLPAQGLAVIAEDQLFGDRARQSRRRRRAARDPESILRDLTDLSEGAAVVHVDYGVGRYRGLQTLEVAEVTTEFLTLEYADGDRLYVPVQSLYLISRYTGGSPETAPLHRLGGDQWQKIRRRAARQIHDVAAELLEVHARRASRVGHSFTLSPADYRAFTAAFPFEETEDQARAIDEVLDSMTSLEPMDRLVCGDVGFGKTEVALRAAFVAVMGGKQVALLVPTTLLAQQHGQTFTDRFADWPIRIEILSRFRTPREAAAVIEDLARGTVDIVIGTHKLLQKSVAFKALGLVIIDEEHRFGVRHKERLKSLRTEVDILTLTATPIPRTLNMALGSLRDLSLIATPPADRLAIKTFVSEWNPAVIREACLREIKRGGQIFFLHNSVKTIERAARELAELVPEAELQIAHGQMRERDLERIMLDFYHRRFNVLVCTTIIESGIDIPTANTIVINRADKFGLAQLHQLRGRVGRSHHRAYAYLITPPQAVLTADAVKRLQAIESLEDLGAGFTLATHDLEIRGAGELLGEEQSGQIQEIGFSLYVELLGRAVAALRRGEVPNLDRPLDSGPEVELGLAALIPADYLADVHMRLTLYKRIASAESHEALEALQIEMIDRFGLLPAPTKTLFRITGLKLRAAGLGIERIEAGPTRGRVRFGKETSVDPAELVSLVQRAPGRYRLDGATGLVFMEDMDDERGRIEAIDALISVLEPDQSPVRVAH